MTRFGLVAAGCLALAACSGSEGDAPAETGETIVPADQTANTEGTGTADAGPEAGTLEWALAGEWRGDNAQRDGFRHPAETLAFLEIDPSSTIIEIWPGGGWYAEILAPWIHANGGTYVAAHFHADSSSEYRQRSRAAFQERFSDSELFGDYVLRGWGPANGGLGEPGSADAVLTFRNVHNWMRGGFTERAFDDFYAVLRPGGILGVVEHRLPDTREQDPMAESGYVQEAYIIAIAEEAGFELVAASEVNANPLDTADHPNGVWTLPPSRSGWNEDGFDSAPFEAIGESDRMTLLFRRPAADPMAEAETDGSTDD